MKARLVIVALVLVVAGFLVLGYWLLETQHRKGSLYPRYSSLRADAFGTKAFYEALEQHLRVERNFRLAKEFDAESEPATVLFLGMPYNRAWSERERRQVESVARRGGRFVLAFIPWTETAEERRKHQERVEELERRLERSSKEKKKSEPTPSPTPESTPAPEFTDGQNADTETLWIRSEALFEKWGVKPRLLERRDTSTKRPATFELPGDQAGSIGWESHLWFELMSDQWRVIARCEGNPVIVERSFGNGTVVLATDSYFLSNDALRNERQPNLLAWIVGRTKRVVFDETHLGISEDPGIATLIRKYRLYGSVAVLILVAGLFVWRNATSLVPKEAVSSKHNASIAGKDATSGLANLLRRNIRSKNLIALCIDEWRKAVSAAVVNRAMPEITRVLANPKLHPVEAYRAIAEILNRKKTL